MSTLVYGTDAEAMKAAAKKAGGAGFRNPNLFDRPEKGVKNVCIIGDYMNVAEVYEEAGAEVDVADVPKEGDAPAAAEPTPAPAKPAAAPAPAKPAAAPPAPKA